MATVDVHRVLTHHPPPVKAQRRKAWDAARTGPISFPTPYGVGRGQNRLGILSPALLAKQPHLRRLGDRHDGRMLEPLLHGDGIEPFADRALVADDA